MHPILTDSRWKSNKEAMSFFFFFPVSLCLFYFEKFIYFNWKIIALQIILTEYYPNQMLSWFLP